MSKLIIVGSGIKSISHITLETHSVIKKADKVLYLLTEKFIEEWVLSENSNSESLEELYFSKEKRVDAYKELEEYIVSESRKYPVLCVVFYGHPCFFANSALSAALKIKESGGEAIILPSVSSADALYADLCIDPGCAGTSFFEATDFLIHNKVFDVSSHLVLFQIGVIGGASHSVNHENLSVLKEYLLSFYPCNHEVTLYEASVLPSINPVINTIYLENLSNSSVSKVTTLYIPPLSEPQYNQEMLKKLGIEIQEFVLS